MFELLYMSVSPNELSEAELNNILDGSRLNNKNNGVTGMLVYHNREIMQLLEGEEATVKALFKSICMDSRHTGIDVFYEGNIKNRAFGQWSMAFKYLDNEHIDALTPGFEALIKGQSPINMVKDNPNRGKKTFLSLRDNFLS